MSIGHDNYPRDGEVCSEMKYPHQYTASTMAHWVHSRIAGCCWGVWGYYKKGPITRCYPAARISEKDPSEPFTLACGGADASKLELHKFKTLEEWRDVWNEDHHRKNGPHLTLERGYVPKNSTREDWCTLYSLRLQDCCMRFWRLTSDGPRRRTDYAYWDSDYKIKIPGYSRYSYELMASDFSLPVPGEPAIREVKRERRRS